MNLHSLLFIYIPVTIQKTALESKRKPTILQSYYNMTVFQVKRYTDSHYHVACDTPCNNVSFQPATTLQNNTDSLKQPSACHKAVCPQFFPFLPRAFCCCRACNSKNFAASKSVSILISVSCYGPKAGEMNLKNLNRRIQMFLFGIQSFRL